MCATRRASRTGQVEEGRTLLAKRIKEVRDQTYRIRACTTRLVERDSVSDKFGYVSPRTGAESVLKLWNSCFANLRSRMLFVSRYATILAIKWYSVG